MQSQLRNINVSEVIAEVNNYHWDSLVEVYNKSPRSLFLCHLTVRKANWLMDARKIVKVESKISCMLPCGDFGVPQGSVLSGLLQVINCNDLPACHNTGEGVVFVNDN